MTYSQFTSDDRDRLQQLLAMGTPIQEIALKLFKHRTSVAREVRRNAGLAGYVSGKAHSTFRVRRAESKPSPKKENRALMEYVEA